MARMTIRDLGYCPGQLPTGPRNSILDVEGVRVGQMTIGQDREDIRKGVTVILPRNPPEIHIPCYAGMHTLNGNGEVSGSHQVADWGYTNTTLKQARNNGTSLETLSHNYGTPVVGETADWFLNDVHESAIDAENFHQAFSNALTQEEVQEGQNGGGAGMTCHMFPGGTGTSSRVVKGSGEVTYTVGAICQSNYGHTHDLQVGGVPIGELILKEKGSTVRRALDAQGNFQILYTYF